jgi:transcriptional regulator with XRE-family HTH domain
MTGMNLATAAGISVSMLSKVENGAISPSLNTLQSLSSALGLRAACY